MSYKDRLSLILVERKLRPSRKYSCERCGIVFYTRKNGVPKYCADCRVVVYYENMNARKKKKRELCKSMNSSPVDVQCDKNKIPPRSKLFT